MRTKKYSFFSVVFVVLALIGVSIRTSRTSAYFQDGSRTIVADDFTNKRQDGSSSNNSTPLGGRIPSTTQASSKIRKRTYKVATTAKTSTVQKTKVGVLAQLGITLWRLRPIQRTDTRGARMLVREGSKDIELVPERVEADTVFREGDQIRLSIESPQVGFLYVVDREIFSDGSFGTAMLIYPWTNMRGPDNQMRPGKLVDIPAQEDQPAFFTARRSSERHVGELLTLVVTSSTLPLPISTQPIEISTAEIIKWEKLWGADSERLELDGGAGETWTPHEQQASASKGSRQLTREDPPPQTIYRLYTANTQAILVNLQLRYAK